jgi:hypothetical protein
MNSMTPFLTIFSAPKPFTDPHISIIQKNAIRSWQNIGEDVDVLLIGDEEGMAEVAVDLGVRYLPDVECNEMGTPLVSSIFDLARADTPAPVLAYINADILVMSDFLEAARLVASQVKDFLVIGQRWDLDVCSELDYDPGWEARLRDNVKINGSLHPPAGSDYFIFTRHLFIDMPKFAIGRAGWDNWAIYHGVSLGWSVITATESIMIVHQNHDYAHLPGGQIHYDLEESRQNAALGGGLANMYTVLEANSVLVDGKVQPAGKSLTRLLRKIELQLITEEQQGLKWSTLRRVRRLRRRLTGSSRDESLLRL